MSDKRRPKGVRLPRLPRRLPQLPQLPAPPPQERQIVIQTTPPGAGGSGAVPPAFRAASEWVWRSLVIGVGIIALLWLISKLSEVVFPVIIALLLAALLEPAFQRLRAVLPRGLAAGVTVLGTLAVLIGLFSFVGNQFASQLDDIVSQVSQGVDESRRWAVNTFGLTEGQITTWVSETWSRLTEGDALSSRAAQAGLTVGQLLTGFFLAMFSLFFFLYDGPGIWAWIVRLFPRGARAKVLSSGAIAWNQLKAFTRATILVAGADALGIGLGAFVLGVPFASGIALLVFFGAFIPVVGAGVSGAVAVLLALVAKGPVTALIMLAVVVGVQQLPGPGQGLLGHQPCGLLIQPQGLPGLLQCLGEEERVGRARTGDAGDRPDLILGDLQHRAGVAQHVLRQAQGLLPRVGAGHQGDHPAAHRRRGVGHGADHRLALGQLLLQHRHVDAGGHREHHGAGIQGLGEARGQILDALGLDPQQHDVRAVDGPQVGPLIVLLAEHRDLRVLGRQPLGAGRGAGGRAHRGRVGPAGEHAVEDRAVHGAGAEEGDHGGGHAALLVSRGTRPRGVGAQMVVTADDMGGFLSGGCIEADVALPVVREAIGRGILYEAT